MNNSIKKIFAGALATASVFCFATACGGDSNNTSVPGGKNGKTITIEAVQLGYGLDWLKAVGDEWGALTGNIVKVVTNIGTRGNEAIEDKVQAKADADIFVYRTAEYAKRVYEGEVTVKGTKYPQVFLDITDVCTTPLEGEGGATIDSKLNAELRNVYKLENNYYGLPWIEGAMGIMRNVDVWNKLGLTDEDIPLTTDQLFDVCETIKDKGTAPFIYSSMDEYYSSFMGVWFMQYESDENIKNYLEGKDQSGNISQNLFTYQGHQEMLSVLENLVKKSNGYQHSRSDGLEFTDMQGYFLQGQSVFCVNGAWLEIEMKSGATKAKIDYIKTPVISALANRLSFKDAADKDDKLATLVKYVDENESGYEGKPEFATEADVDTVRTARKRSYVAQGSSHLLAGSAYTKNPEEVKDFIRYLYSDKGMDCYYRATGGASLPLNLSANGSYSNIEISDFQKEVNKMNKDELVVFASAAKMYAIGGVNIKMFNGISSFVNELYNGTTTASGILNANNKYMSDNWAQISSTLGIN